MPIRILLADDDPHLRRVIQYKLGQQGYMVTAVEDGNKALAALQSEPFDLLLTDMKMPGIDGLELLEKTRQVRPETEVILITAHATVPQAVKAVKLGAFDYLTKPFEDEELFVTIEKAIKFRKLEAENKQLRQQLKDRTVAEPVWGLSTASRELIALVDKIAPTDATVLLTGESGSGKEVIARAIHSRSLRSEGPFVAVNCAAIPKELIESELFGHIKGAFTGAVRDKKGKFELAEGGTLLLDEISELSIELQAKLLRVIQERVIEPVGSESKTEIDIRLLAATNTDLKERVTSGKFREDLYYRLNVIPLTIPPLRERRDDVTVLTQHFLQKFSNGEAISIDPSLTARLSSHDWPGNVRELENLIERMIILRKADSLSTADLPSDFGHRFNQPESESGAGHSGGTISFHDAEKNLIVDALDKCGWNKTKASQLLQVPRHVLVYRMKKYDIFNNRKT